MRQVNIFLQLAKGSLIASADITEDYQRLFGAIACGNSEFRIS
jgi:hypothetical protein